LITIDTYGHIIGTIFATLVALECLKWLYVPNENAALLAKVRMVSGYLWEQL
jgi:hypothetical protein